MMFPRPVFVDPAWNEETSPDQTSKTLAAGTGSEGPWPDASRPGEAHVDARSTLPAAPEWPEWDPEIERIFSFLRGQRLPAPKK
jgi:hypothetical protein